MPHLIVEYSDNLEPRMEVHTLLRRLHDAAEATGIFQPATIRTRARPCAHYVVGTGTGDDAFVHLEARIRPGRPETVQWSLAESLMAVLKDTFATELEGNGVRVGLTVEVTLIPPVRVLYSTLDPDGSIMSIGRPTE